MNDIEIGQVLSMKIRFNNTGNISKQNHPYLIIDIDRVLNVIEIAQIDSLEGKIYKAAFRSNKTIYCDDPKETVIDKDSFIQLDNTIKIENHPDIIRYRRQKDKLSVTKLNDIINCYKNYHDQNKIDENKQVFISKEELDGLN